jgi:peptidoglycan/LPS O-acetylase OafA/YrhL
MTSLSDRIAAADGRPAGFDYMRLVLASSVILHHAFTVTAGMGHGQEIWDSPDRAVIGLILPLFFALSGFLVAGSLERTRSIVGFLGMRVIRLVPALAVEVTLSALILGPLLTTVSLAAYFGSPTFQAYFLNMIGEIHYYLPGVFLHNPSGRAVNSQLWTIPFELQCYVALAGLALLGLAARTRILAAALIALQVGVAIWLAVEQPDGSTVIPGEVMTGCFLAGVLLYKLRRWIPVRADLFWLCLVGTMGLILLPYGYYFICLPAAYVTVYLGTMNPKRTWVVASGDYSYGLYLYGYPLQQALTSLGRWSWNPWIDVALVYPVAFLLALASWRLVEKPALGLKRYIGAFEGRMLLIPAFAWHSERVFGGRAAAVPARTVEG